MRYSYITIVRAITVTEMYTIDRNCEYIGIPRRILMENAGKEVARYIINEFPDKRRITVVAGLGDNGGDGAVAARYLHESDREVRLVVLGRIDDSRSEIARENFRIARLLGVETYEVTTVFELYAIMDIIVTWPDIIVDAVLGTGIRGALRDLQYNAIRLMNMSKATKVCVDVPSGLDPDTGQVRDIAVKGDVTITMHRPKIGLTRIDAEKYVGKLVVADIGIPREAEHIVGPGDLIYLKWQRKRESKKGDHGRVVIVGGSDEFAGAPALAALTAFRLGVDIVTVISPRSAAHDIRSQTPNLIVIPVEGRYFTEEHVDIVYQYCTRADVILIGPGISTRETTMSFTARLFEKLVETGRRVVVDADGIKALATHDLTNKIGKNVIVTPHAREYSLLLKAELPRAGNPWKRGEEVARQVAEKCSGGTVLLKGNIDIITDGETWKINMTGNPGMTVGGTGDVLSGAVTALCTKCDSAFHAACIASFIVGLAGDLAVRDLGYHILPTDVIERIPTVMRRLLSENVEIERALHYTSRGLMKALDLY